MTILSSGCINGFSPSSAQIPFSGLRSATAPPASHLSTSQLLKAAQQNTLDSKPPASFDSLKKYADQSHPIWQNDGAKAPSQVMRAQSPDANFQGGFGYSTGSPSLTGAPQVAQGSGTTQTAGIRQAAAPQGSGSRSTAGVSQAFQPATSQQQSGGVKQATYAPQFPETRLQDRGTRVDSQSAVDSIDIGNRNESNPLVRPNPPSGVATFPHTPNTDWADLHVYANEAQTGRINIGGAFNSDNGIVGNFTIDERNFDISRFPRSFRDIRDGVAWRGAGQTFRLELVPGAEIQRYLVSFGEPYLFNTPISFSASAYLNDRQFLDWDEERLGVRFNLGYRLTPDLSVSAGLRLENVDVSDPSTTDSAQLNDVLGDNDLYVASLSLIRDTRDSQVAATEGTYLSLSFQQAFGEFDYPRGDIEFRNFRLLKERPDGSGRHTLSFGTRLGFSGSQTPLFENYLAGGFSTIRGFDFRGVGPIEDDIRVGGDFQWLNTIEYTFPITADDMVKGVVFCDFGTIEDDIEIDSDNIRVAPGFGFRVQIPALGIGAPLAFDFAFPVEEALGDEKQTFSFYLGVLR